MKGFIGNDKSRTPQCIIELVVCEGQGDYHIQLFGWGTVKKADTLPLTGIGTLGNNDQQDKQYIYSY